MRGSLWRQDVGSLFTGSASSAWSGWSGATSSGAVAAPGAALSATAFAGTVPGSISGRSVSASSSLASATPSWATASAAPTHAASGRSAVIEGELDVHHLLAAVLGNVVIVVGLLFLDGLLLLFVCVCLLPLGVDVALAFTGFPKVELVLGPLLLLPCTPPRSG